MSRPSPIQQAVHHPKEFAWQSLHDKSGDELEIHYRHLLEQLAKQKGMLGIIFRKARNKIKTLPSWNGSSIS